MNDQNIHHHFSKKSNISPQSFVITSKHKANFKLAKNVAVQSEHPIFKHGAVLVNGSRVINTGFNSFQYTSFGDRFRYHDGYATRHAEISAILGVDRRHTQDGVLYVVRISKSFKYRNSQPCLMCQNVLKFVGIKKVFFSTNHGFRYVVL